jgi:hypothetical protein
LHKKLLLCTLCIAISLLSLTVGVVFANKVDDSIVATINGEKITESELYFYIKKYGEESKIKDEEGKKKLLDKLIKFKVLLVVSREYGEEEKPLFKYSYSNYVRSKYAERFRINLANKINVTQDDIDLAFVESDKSGSKKTEEEIKEAKKRIKEGIFRAKYNKELKKEIEKLIKSYNIKIYHELIKELDSGKEIDDESIIYEVADEKISYARLMSMIPANVRHSNEEMKRKKDFLYALINQEVEVSVLAVEAKRLKLTDSDIFFHLNNQEYYEKLLVSMLDYNETFTNKAYGHVKISDAEIKEYYNENRDVLDEHAVMLKVLKLQFLDKPRAMTAHDELKKGAKFQDVAEKYSKNEKWDLGFLPKKELKRIFGEEASKKLYKQKVGEISDVITLGKSYLIITFAERNDEKAALKSVKPAIKSRLMREKSEKAFEKYTQKLRENTDISINEDILKRVSIE